MSIAFLENIDLELMVKLRKRGGEMHESQKFKIYPIFEIRAHEYSGREKEAFNFDLL